jgi:hypothetical protein
MNDNPYAPPQAHLESQSTEAEAIRNEHLSHEASLKAVGALYYLSAAMLIIGGVSLVVGPGGDDAARGGAMQGPIAGGLLLLLAVGAGALGFGLRRLKSWTRIPAAIFSGLGMLNIPIGTLINGYILYLILSRKGRTVLSAEYAEVVAQTPHLRYRTPVYIWVILAILVLLFAAALLLPMVLRH